MRRSEQEILAMVYRRSGQIRMRRHMLQIFAGAVAAALLLTVTPTLVRQLSIQKLNTADQPKTEEAIRNETIEGGIQTITGGPLAPGALPLFPGSLPGTPQVSYSDQTPDQMYGSPPAGSTFQGPAGSLDPTFGGTGKVTTDFGPQGGSGKAMAVQPDGRIVVAGFSGGDACGSSCSDDADFALARYNPDGSLDTTFGAAGKVTTDFSAGDDYGTAVVIDPNGRIVVAGCSDKVGGVCSGTDADFALARYNSDGSLDLTFGTGGKVTTDFGSGFNYDYGRAVAIQPGGLILVAGSSSSQAPAQGSPVDFALARYNPNGSLDTTFGTAGKVTTNFGASDYGEALVLQPDGRIVVAGGSIAISGDSADFALARYNPNGSLDTTFDADGKVVTDFGFGSDYAKAVVLQPDGRIVVAGNALARYNPNGSLDSTFGTEGKVTGVSGGAVAIQPDGRIVVGGSMSGGSFGKGDFALARYNPNGSLDSTFGTEGKVTTNFDSTTGDAVGGVAIQPDGRIVAAGFTGAPSTYRFAVVRYRG